MKQISKERLKIHFKNENVELIKEEVSKRIEQIEKDIINPTNVKNNIVIESLVS